MTEPLSREQVEEIKQWIIAEIGSLERPADEIREPAVAMLRDMVLTDAALHAREDHLVRQLGEVRVQLSKCQEDRNGDRAQVEHPLVWEDVVIELKEHIVGRDRKIAALRADHQHVIAERDALKERLEMDYGYDADGNRVPCPGIPDGIACRDATISLIEAANTTLKQQLEALRADHQRVTLDWQQEKARTLELQTRIESLLLTIKLQPK